MWVERSEPNPARGNRGNGGLERAGSLQKVEDLYICTMLRIDGIELRIFDENKSSL